MSNGLAGSLRLSVGRGFAAETSSFCIEEGGCGAAGSMARKEFRKPLVRVHGMVWFELHVSRSW